MNASIRPPERLEDRIAPAGLITATLDQGALTLADGVDPTSLFIQQAGAKTWVLLGCSGTLIEFDGAPPAALVFISGITGEVTLPLATPTT